MQRAGETRQRVVLAGAAAEVDFRDCEPVRSGRGQVARTFSPGDEARAGQRRIGQHAAQREVVAHRPKSDEHTSELQSLMRTSYAVFCLQKHKKILSN